VRGITQLPGFFAHHQPKFSRQQRSAAKILVFKREMARSSLGRSVAQIVHPSSSDEIRNYSRIAKATMKTREIPRAEWRRFFDNISCRQQGWEVELEVFSPDIGDQIEERHMFLTGITAELTDKVDRSNKIEIMMAAAPSNHVTHMISTPVLVQLQQTDRGIDTALRIKSADGITSLLHLR
jgi:hypothetical protein